MLLSVTGCKEQSPEMRELANVQRLQLFADQIVYQIQYLKDPRTNQCFAYFWDGAGNGGPAFTAVNCESIPTELLIVATQK
ncbi:hypothetical protein HYV70_04695 [Candidatus Uhrbacteria bacterium]|nr:hypothetical protein [Candidatus Uhrbacteria bacterium]